MSGPLLESSARLTVFTRSLKPMNLRLILTFGYLFSKFAVICSITSCRPGFWLSYDQTLSSTGPSDSNPLVLGGVAVGEFTPDVRAYAGPVNVAAVSATHSAIAPSTSFLMVPPLRWVSRSSDGVVRKRLGVSSVGLRGDLQRPIGRVDDGHGREYGLNAEPPQT